MLLNYKYEIHPTLLQATILSSWISMCRHTYNSALLDRSHAYKERGESLNVYSLQSIQKIDKKRFPFLKEMPSQPLQESLHRLEKAFNNFFRKDNAYPKLKKFKDYNSLTFTQFGIGKRKDAKTGEEKDVRYAASLGESDSLLISKLGELQVDWHRQLEGKVKQVIIKRQGTRWYAIFSVEKQAISENLDKDNAVGIDVGIKTFAHLSDDTQIENPKFLRKSERKLKRIQKKVSKKRKGSANYKKQVLKMQKVHAKVANQRKDFLHKTSYQLSNSYSILVVEDLNIRHMVKNRKLAKSIHDAGWGMFRNFLDYKCQRVGGRLLRVAPHYASQDCSGCNNRVKKSLSKRTHVCVKCGTVLDRDHNAALNILNKGFQLV